MTQIVSVLALPEEALHYLESLEPAEQRWFTERRLRGITSLPSKQQQLSAFQLLLVALLGPKGPCKRRPKQ